MQNIPFVGIAGIIGVGKSTLTEKLAKKLGVPAFWEPVKENPYLEEFYKNIGRWAFSMQVHLLNERFVQHQEIVWLGKGAIQDRTIYEDTIFAEMLYEAGFITEIEYKTYLNLFLNMTKFLQRPDVIIFLDVKPEIALERIKMRNRGAESGITLDYLIDLKNGYEKFYDRLGGVLNIQRVDWNEFGKEDDLIQSLELSELKNRWGSHF